MAMLDTSHDGSPEALNWVREMPTPHKEDPEKGTNQTHPCIWSPPPCPSAETPPPKYFFGFRQVSMAT